MSDTELAGVVFAAKLATELAASWSDNDYLTARPVRSALTMAAVAAAAIPIGRLIIAEGNNYAAGAMILAVFLARWAGCRDLEKRKRKGKE